MAVNKVEICGLDTSKLPMMTYERSTELLKKISEGDEEARDIFIKENLRLVLSVIQRFSGRGEQMDDLFQVGCIGLIKAINNFDLSFNVRFSTYAVPMIIGEVRRHLRDNNSLRVSRSIRDTAYHALQMDPTAHCRRRPPQTRRPPRLARFLVGSKRSGLRSLGTCCVEK